MPFQVPRLRMTLTVSMRYTVSLGTNGEEFKGIPSNREYCQNEGVRKVFARPARQMSPQEIWERKKGKGYTSNLYGGPSNAHVGKTES